MNSKLVTSSLLAASVAALFLSQVDTASSQFTFNARDPGVRDTVPGAPSAGAPLPDLTASQLAFFNSGLADFNSAEEVDEGLGPRMNLDGCGGCHIQPAVGGTSPFVNPQVPFDHARNPYQLPAVAGFSSANAPVRAAGFVDHAAATPAGGLAH